MSNVIGARTWSPGRVAAVVILAVIGVLAVVAAIMFFTEPARSLPSVLGTITQPASRADAHRSTRGVVSLAIGVVCLVAAAFASVRHRTAPR